MYVYLGQMIGSIRETVICVQLEDAHLQLHLTQESQVHPFWTYVL